MMNPSHGTEHVHWRPLEHSVLSMDGSMHTQTCVPQTHPKRGRTPPVESRRFSEALLAPYLPNASPSATMTEGPHSGQPETYFVSCPERFLNSGN